MVIMILVAAFAAAILYLEARRPAAREDEAQSMVDWAEYNTPAYLRRGRSGRAQGGAQ